jgi:hypothetical protein
LAAIYPTALLRLCHLGANAAVGGVEIDRAGGDHEEQIAERSQFHKTTQRID